ncbi:GATA transcription factor 7-like [Impatiens glandulifera]|uniref:GATA transcription factor 7-like n=1 Tax=Impatiens glandulifera TaxID=253017 RepID=UPI001FB0FCFE|nr:GATA transcription factor 7-like [Impatiens glandulifera]
MESMEAKALKSSVLSSEFSIKSNHQIRPDDFCYVNGGGTGGGGNAEDFSVDVFLDLSNHDLQPQDDVDDDDDDDLSEQATGTGTYSLSVSNDIGSSNCCSAFSDSLDSSFFPDELNIPPEDDFEDLEWLSRLVDDSSTELIHFSSPTTTTTTRNCSDPILRIPSSIPTTPLSCFPVPVPAKTRSKRERPSGRIWPPSSSSSSSNDPSSSFIIINKQEQTLSHVPLPVEQKQKKKKARVSSETGTEEAVEAKTQRRCTHCEVQKTPQWRRGPLGPKSLCNACGVRFKSGRLFPEYRPACSPTFSGEVHSNSHRRVLEMRNRVQT